MRPRVIRRTVLLAIKVLAVLLLAALVLNLDILPIRLAH